jgi:signal transduction histidine kinase
VAGRLCIMVCERFHAEAAAALAAEAWDDVDCVAFAAQCGRPALSWLALRALLPPGCTQLVMMGHACMAALGLGEPIPVDFPPLQRRPQKQCFHLVAPEPLVAEAVASGAYLMTPSWLADWRAHLAELGFGLEQAGEFFADFANELLLLDTGTAPETAARLQALALKVPLPVRRVPVGLGTMRAVLVREVMAWRLQAAQEGQLAQTRQHARERADQAASMDMLARLTRVQHEAEAIAAIRDLLQMLFAPRQVHHLRVLNGVDLPTPGIPEELLAPLALLTEDYAFTPDGEGFLLRISHAGGVVGKVAVLGLAFPTQRERYVNMALTLTRFCGLVIENARMRHKLLEAEKMASLSILVSGVAHEINTPLGVDLVASTALNDQTRQLARHFAERQMTASELEGFLQKAEQETSLIRNNLERIGALVDTFRQAATGGPAPQAAPLKLHECVNEVIRSLGDRVLAAGVKVHLACDPTLQIHSIRSDWASVFTNLIANSLKHGFKGLAGGEIHIRIEAGPQQLQVHYRDTGRGMAPEVLAKVFEPFFTTDLQRNMGLGMHLVYNLVTQRFGGSISCESRPGQGACFLIEVPR